MSSEAEFLGTLAELADLAEIRGAGTTASDLRRALNAVSRMPAADRRRFIQRAGRNAFEPEAGISPAIRWRLHEVASGDYATVRGAALAGVPRLLQRLIEIAAVTTAEAATLVRQAAILTLPDLEAAIRAGRLESLVGAPLAARLKQAAAALALETRLLPLGRASELLESLAHALSAACPALDRLVPAGDVRRAEVLVSAPVLVGCATDPLAALEVITALPLLEDVRHRGARRAILVVQQAEVDVRIATPDDYGTTLFRATGSAAHVAAIEGRRSRTRIAAREEDLYKHAGLPFIPPELRNNDGEVEAAAGGALPALVRREDIRGDLHMHSTYSDGRDTIEAMVAAAAAIGYEYIAITDHSARAGASRTLALDQIDRQRDEIARVRERFSGITILHGVEVDVMPDGQLDFPDAVLERFDIVLASMHDAARQDARRLTARCLQAIRHPLVTILTHPANRIVGRRGDYPLDYDAVYAAAAESGTALEIDGAPLHLDLDSVRARAAARAGVTLVIDSDSHRAGVLGRQMGYGVALARRGWVEAGQVLNTRPLEEVRRFIAAKRGRR